MFHEHKNTELNHFSYISKGANFRVLQVSFRYVCHLSFQQKEGKHKVYSTKHYATQNHIHRRILSSKLDFAFYKIQVWGMKFFKNISCHVANLSWSSLPSRCARLAKSLTNKNLNNHAPLVHHTYSCFYLNESVQSFKVPCYVTSMLQNIIQT